MHPERAGLRWWLWSGSFQGLGISTRSSPRADLEAAGYTIDQRWQRSQAALMRNNKRKLGP
jgi:hypothetical protein